MSESFDFEYMLNELHSSIGEKIDLNNLISIDNKRNFNVGSEFDTVIAYEGDVNSQIIIFQLPESHEGHKLSECQYKKLKWKNLGNNIEGISELEIHEEDGKIASWIVPPEAFTSAGIIEISISIYDIKNGKIAFSWNTPTYKGLSVGEAFSKVGEATNEEHFPSKDEILFINDETRAIVAPKGYNNVVCNFGDKNTSKIYFQVKRYINGIDVLGERTNIGVIIHFDAIDKSFAYPTDGDQLIIRKKNYAEGSVGDGLITLIWNLPPWLTNNNDSYMGSFSIALSFTSEVPNEEQNQIEQEKLEEELQEVEAIELKWTTSPYKNLIIGNVLPDEIAQASERPDIRADWNAQSGPISISNKPLIKIGENKYATEIGVRTQAGCNAFRITDIEPYGYRHDTKPTEMILTLDSVEFLEKGDVCSIIVNSNYMNFGAITAIDKNKNKITVNNYPETLTAAVLDKTTLRGLESSEKTKPYLFIADKQTVLVDEEEYPVGTVSIDKGQVAEGIDSKALLKASHAEGDSTTAAGRYSHAEGSNTYAGYAAHAEGQNSKAIGNVSHAEGGQTTASGLYSHTEGQHSTASGNHSHAEGYQTTAEGNRAHAEGYKTSATGTDSHSEGSLTTASGEQSHAEGTYTTASAQNAHSEGARTVASGTNGAHAEGCNSVASGTSSHAEGDSTTASGGESHSEGSGTRASGWGAHAEGRGTIASGHYSHTEGLGTKGIGDNSHAEGNATKAYGISSHAEGLDTSAGKDGETNESAAHAEGKYTKATGDASHAEGNSTEASGAQSHAEGLNSKAVSPRSHAEGYGTIASSDSQHVQGKYNIEDKNNKYAHIVGNGTNATRRNAHTLDWSGNAWFAGEVRVGGTKYDDGKKLATEEFVRKLSLQQGEDGKLYLALDGTTFGDGIVISGVIGSVVGYIDGENNIILTGNLNDGEYNIQYKQSNGDYTEIGGLTIDNTETPEAEPLNLLTIAVDGNGNQGNQSELSNDGFYTEAKRIRYSYGNMVPHDQSRTTGFIPVKQNDIICFKNIPNNYNTSESVAMIAFYKSYGAEPENINTKHEQLCGAQSIYTNTLDNKTLPDDTTKQPYEVTVDKDIIRFLEGKSDKPEFSKTDLKSIRYFRYSCPRLYAATEEETGKMETDKPAIYIRRDGKYITSASELQSEAE